MLVTGYFVSIIIITVIIFTTTYTPPPRPRPRTSLILIVAHWNIIVTLYALRTSPFCLSPRFGMPRDDPEIASKFNYFGGILG